MKVNDGTLSESINGIKSDRYGQDFNVQEGRIVYHHTNTALSPEDFLIDKVYRFEGASNPEDQPVLYAISSSKFNIKGIYE